MTNTNLQTHPNFKSLDPNIQTVDAMAHEVGYAIRRQRKITKLINPKDWKNRKPKDFKIDLEKIDRLYYIYCDDAENYFNLLCRMQGEFYIEMKAIRYNCFDLCCVDRGAGTIYVSRDANLFMTQVLPNNSRYDKTLIYESLRKDDIYIKEEEINQIPQMNDAFSFAETLTHL